MVGFDGALVGALVGAVVGFDGTMVGAVVGFDDAVVVSYGAVVVADELAEYRENNPVAGIAACAMLEVKIKTEIRFNITTLIYDI